jgi:hypothetical protein
MGIKIKWVYTSEENWNRTHRLGGKVWVIVGFLCLPATFLPLNIGLTLLPILLAVAVILPTVYSYLYYKKERDEGKLQQIDKTTPEYQRNKRYKAGAIIAVAILLIGIGFLMFTGDITPRYEDASFTLEASFMGDLTLDYADIDAIEYCEKLAPAQRTMGYGSARLMIGTFRSDELGNHTRYTYTQCKEGILLTVDGKSIVINQSSAAETRALYNELVARCGK